MKGLSRTIRLSCGIALIGWLSPAWSTAGLDVSSTSNLANIPSAIRVTDIDGDGNGDFLLSFSDVALITVLFGDGAGGFTGSQDTVLDTAWKTFVLGDFDNDGKTDVAGIRANSNFADVWLGDGAGSFAKAVTLATGAKPEGLVAVQLDADALDDLVIANADDDDVRIFLAAGAGMFGAGTDLAVGNYPVSLIAGRFDGDVNNDVLVVNVMDSTAEVLLGDGAGNLASNGSFLTRTPAIASSSALPVSAASGDFNADGRTDLVFAHLLANEVQVFLGDGLGGFATETLVARQWNDQTISITSNTTLTDPNADIDFLFGGSAIFPLALQVFDVTREGNPDVVLSMLGKDALQVVPGDGAGGFNALQMFDINDDALAINAGDLDAGGISDLGITSAVGSTAIALLNNDLVSRSPVAVNLNLTVAECGVYTVDNVVFDIDGDDLIYGTVSMNVHHGFEITDFLNNFMFEVFDTGATSNIDLFEMDYNVTDGAGVSDTVNLMISVSGNGIAGTCPTANTFDIQSDLVAENDIVINSSVPLSLSGPISITSNKGALDIAIPAGVSGGAGGGSGSIGIVSPPGGGMITIATAIGGATVVTSSSASVTITTTGNNTQGNTTTSNPSGGSTTSTGGGGGGSVGFLLLGILGIAGLRRRSR